MKIQAKPKCIVVSGRPGSGKTTLSLQVSENIHMPLISRDSIKEGLVNSYGVPHDKLPSEVNKEATELFFSLTEAYLRGKISVIVEAAFQHRVWQEVYPRWSQLADVFFVICEAEPELCAKRHLERGLEDPARTYYHGDNRVKVFKETGEVLGPGEYEAPSFETPTLVVSTTDGYDPSLEHIEKFVR